MPPGHSSLPAPPQAGGLREGRNVAEGPAAEALLLPSSAEVLEAATPKHPRQWGCPHARQSQGFGSSPSTACIAAGARTGH